MRTIPTLRSLLAFSPTSSPAALASKLAMALVFLVAGLQEAAAQTLGDYRTRTGVTADWNGTSTWQEYDGAVWNDVSTNPNSGDGVITVRGDATITITAGVSIDQTVVEAGALVIQSTSSTVNILDGTGTDLSILGTWRHTSSSTSNPLPIIVGGGSISVGSTGVFEHAISSSGGTLPLATWNATSTVRISNTGGGTLSNAVNQTFGNMEFTGAAACSLSNSISSESFTIQGDLVMSSSGTVVFKSNNADLTATVNGDFILNGSGTFRMDNATFSPFGTQTKRITVGGDFQLSSGTFDFTSTSPGGTRNFFLDVAGDFLHTGGTLTQSSTTTGTANSSVVTLNGTSGTQQLESPGQTRMAFNVAGSNAQCVVASGKSFTANGNRGFTIAGGTASPDLVIDGTFLNQLTVGNRITATGTWSLSSGSNYIHNSASGISTAMSNLTMNAASTFTYRYTGTSITSSFTGRTYGNLRFESTVAGPYNETFGTGGTTLTVAGTLTVGDGAFPVNLGQGSFTGTLNFTGDITISQDATLSCRSFTLGSTRTLTLVNPASFSLAASEAGQTFTLTGTTKVYNTNGFAGASNRAISDANSPAIDATASGTIEFLGAAAQSAAGLPATVHSILVNNASGVTLGNSSALNGNLTVAAGTLDMDIYTLDRSSVGGTLTLASGTGLRIGGTNTFPADYAVNDVNFESAVEYAGTTQTVRGIIYGHLVLSGVGLKAMSISANASTNDLSLANGTTLELANERLVSVFGDQVVLDGTVVPHQGELELLSFDPTTISTTGTVDLYNLTVVTTSGTVATGGFGIHGTLLLAAGNFDATGAAVVLRSTLDGTGRLGPVDASANYLGNLTTERRIPGGATNWRLLGSAVGSETVLDWKDDFLMAGFPGSHYPNFSDPPGNGNPWPSVRWYDETNPGNDQNDGLVGVSGTAQALASGQGFAVWSGDALGGTLPFVIDVTGAPHIAHTPIGLPVSWTDTSTPAADGWNLVSNPLPSPIDFSSITRGADVEDAYWIYNPANGNNATWNGVTYTNGANGTIQSSQGFWLKANGPAVTTTVDEAVKVNDGTGGLFGGQEGDPVPLLRLKLHSGINQFSDETVVVFSDGHPAFEAGDVAQFIFGHPSAPQISTRSSDGVDLSISMYGTYNRAIAIPVLVRAPITGTYTVTATELTALGNLSCLSIEDLLTGTITPLSEGVSYNFSVDANADANLPRLMVHATAPLPFEALDASCHGLANGAATVTIISGPLDVTWTDAFGGVLLQQNNMPTGGASISGLAGGNYAVRVTGDAGCGTLSRDFTIADPFALEAAPSTTDATCPNIADGLAGVEVMGGTTPYSYAWSNGGTTAAIMAGAGTYSVIITDAMGCTLEAGGLVVGSGPGPTALFQVENTLVIVGQPTAFVNTGDLGESVLWDFGDGSTSTDPMPQHTYAQPGTYTATLTVQANGCWDMYSLDVIVQASTGVPTGGTVPVMNAWTDGQRIFVEHTFNDGRAVDVEVLDATGRLHVRSRVAGTPGRTIIPAEGLGTGVWFVRLTSGKEQQTFRVPLVR